MRRLSGYPKWMYGFSLIVLIGVLASALCLLPNTLEMRLDLDVPVHVGGAFRLTSAALHSLSGFFALALLGALSTLHIRVNWRRRLNRISGAFMIGILLLLFMSALGIYYLGDPDLNRYISVFHTVTGFVLAAIFIWHSVRGHQIRTALRPQTPMQ